MTRTTAGHVGCQERVLSFFGEGLLAARAYMLGPAPGAAS